MAMKKESGSTVIALAFAVQDDIVEASVLYMDNGWT
jgi:hypothetical protein